MRGDDLVTAAVGQIQSCSGSPVRESEQWTSAERAAQQIKRRAGIGHPSQIVQAGCEQVELGEFVHQLRPNALGAEVPHGARHS